MLGLVVPLALLLFPSAVVAQRGLHHSSLPEDLYAFPKYRVSFLNGLPVLNETAQRWLAEGLTGGEGEFLGSSPALETAPEETQTAVSSRTGPPADGPVSTLHHMRMGPQSYLCLIPPPPDVPPPADDFTQPPAPAKSWELLAPLKGTCLYHRQGWFTYSYCHGEHVRQFRALTTNQPNTPGGRVPQEDKDEASYTLGHAPSSDVAVNDEQNYFNGLETARGAGHRYLVQRWGEGTVCDKTGRKREIEVQFHCSMTTTDVILFVKETRTCHYTLVIHTPRLCGEPGFKSPHDDLKETVMRCRHIVDSLDRVDNTLPDAPYPLTRAPKPPPPLVGHSKSDPSKATSKGKGKQQQKPSQEFIRRAIEALMGDEDLMGAIRGRKDGADAEVVVVMEGEEEDGEPRLLYQETGETLGDVLKKAGYDIKGSMSDNEEEEEGVVEELPSHDEL